MAISIFILISLILKFIISKNLNDTNYSYQLKDSHDQEKFQQCIMNIVKTFMGSDSSEKKINKTDIICVLEVTEKNPSLSRNFFVGLKGLIRNYVGQYLEKVNLTYTHDFVLEILDDKSTFINDLFDFIEKDTNSTLINYAIGYLKNDSSINEISGFSFACKILNMEGSEKVCNHLLESSNKYVLFELLKEYYIPGTNYTKMYVYLEPMFKKYTDMLVNLLYKIFKYYDFREDLIDLTEEFFVNNTNTDFIRELRDILRREEVRKEFTYKIVFHSKPADAIKNELLKTESFVVGFFDLLNRKEVINIIADVCRNKNNATYIEEKVPEMIKNITKLNSTYLGFLLEVSEKTLRGLVTQSDINEMLGEEATKKLRAQFFDVEIAKYNISYECYDSMMKIYFNSTKELNITDDQAKNALYQLRYFFLKKTVIDSTKLKNDFLTYENCLEKPYHQNGMDLLKFNFVPKPMYLMAMFDDSENKTNLSDTIFVEHYNYWLGYCLPYLERPNGSNLTGQICSDRDYNNILRIFMEAPYNMKTAEIQSFRIYELEFKTEDIIYGTLSLLIILIPIFIQIFLLIYYSIAYHRQKKSIIINQLMLDEKEQKEIEKKKKLNHHKKERIKKEKINTPKWFKYLNEYFNLVKNGAELFINNSKESNINNINGITYIKGLLGSSMILYIFGHTFLILFNLPFKNFKLTDFNSSMTNFFIFLLLISLRYCPRVILSCSGYTLIYKYLNFIDLQPRLYLLKFIFRQSHKYLLLIIAVLYMRYSIYYLNIILSNAIRPMMKILKYNLEKNNKEYFLNFFDFLLGYTGDASFKTKQNIIQYFYVPLNEIFLFLFGVILISFGFRYKLRIEIFIIIVILVIFIGKIVFCIINLNRAKMYPTLYFYLYDYGAIMLNPLFNLPSFLIGMFFGLINYSIQKGISLNSYDTYKRIFSLGNREPTLAESETESINLKNYHNVRATMKHENDNIIIKLNNFKESEDKNQECIRSYSQMITTDKNPQSNKNIEKNDSVSFNMSFTAKEEYDEKIKEMPFLILPIKFLNFHRQNEGRFYFRIIVYFFILLITFFSLSQFIFSFIYARINVEVDKIEDIKNKLSFSDIIKNPILNFIYAIDIELVVFMINWGFFILYSKGYKTADIYDFFNNNFWAFFLKCYYTFIIFSTPIILSIIYQSETVIKFGFLNVLLFSFINLIMVFFVVILFYSMYEIPLKKIFKSFLVKDEILSENMDDNESVVFDLSDRISK